MKNYFTVTDISNFIGINRKMVTEIIKQYNIEYSSKRGQKKIKVYSLISLNKISLIYQMIKIKKQKEIVFNVYESKMNYEST